MPTNNFPNIGKVTYGYAHNYFQKYSVTATTFGGDTVDGYQPSLIINLPEVTNTVIFTNLAVTFTGSTPSYTTAVIEYSFDGNTVHGELGSAPSNVSIYFANRVISLIWFRIQSGSSGPINVSVQAWGIR